MSEGKGIEDIRLASMPVDETLEQAKSVADTHQKRILSTVFWGMFQA